MLQEQAFRILLAERGSAVVPVADGDASMRPLLEGGDLVLAVSPVTAPRAGDLIVYAQHDYLVVHRYLGEATAPDGTPCLRTRGDGRNRLDPPVLPRALRARVVAVRRGGIWLSLEGRRARVFARLIAWHALAWSAAGVALGAVGLGAAARVLDAALLRSTSILIPIVFRRIPAPAAAGAAPPVG